MDDTEFNSLSSKTERHPTDTREVDPLTPEDEGRSCRDNIRHAWNKVKRYCKTFASLLKAFTTRIIFTLHFLLAYWVVIAQVEWSFGFWFLPLGLFAMLIESVVTFYIRKGQDYKW